MIISSLTANVHTLQLAHCQRTYPTACSLPVYIPCSSLTASVHTLQLGHCQCTYLAARLLPMYIPCRSLTASVHTLQLAHCQCTYLASCSLPMYVPCSSLSASVHTLQLAHCQCTSLAVRSLPVYIPCSLLTANVHTLQLAHCQCTYTLQLAPANAHTLQLAYGQCTYLAARSLPMYIPCSSLTASVHTLQLAQSLRQCTYLAARSLQQCTYLAARSLPVYIPCSSFTASVHTLHVNKKYTRRPHERSAVQFMGHVDLVFRTSPLPNRINPKLLWVFSVHAVSTVQSRESSFAINPPRYRTESGRKNGRKKTPRDRTMRRVPSRDNEFHLPGWKWGTGQEGFSIERIYYGLQL